ncbi:MAG: transposase [Acetobacteraceae bacterium]|nr:transposase [Acetobacteraceae bacterium]
MGRAGIAARGSWCLAKSPLLALPPYSPELNPVERIWRCLRSHGLANSVFRSLVDIADACEAAWNRFATDPGLICSLYAVAWLPVAASG